MNASVLAELMLKWETRKGWLDETEAEIKKAVLKLGKAADTGNVRASYSTGRKRYDYQDAADGHVMVSRATVGLFTTVIPETEKVDWRGICKHAGIEDIPFTQSEPSVTVKLLVE